MSLEIETNKIDVQYKWTTASKKGHELTNNLLQLIISHFFLSQTNPIQIQGLCVSGLTEYTHNKATYRAHPLYKNEGPWFDWVLNAWNMPTKNKASTKRDDDSPDHVDLLTTHVNGDVECNLAMLIPAKLICIIKDESYELFAIVHSCHQHRKKSQY